MAPFAIEVAEKIFGMLTEVVVVEEVVENF